MDFDGTAVILVLVVGVALLLWMLWKRDTPSS